MFCLCSKADLFGYLDKQCLLIAYTFHNVGDACQGSLVIWGVFAKWKLLPRIPAQVEYDRVSVPMVPHFSSGHILNKGSRTVVNA